MNAARLYLDGKFVAVSADLVGGWPVGCVRSAWRVVAVRGLSRGVDRGARMSAGRFCPDVLCGRRKSVAERADLVAWLLDSRLRAFAQPDELRQFAGCRVVFTEVCG